MTTHPSYQLAVRFFGSQAELARAVSENPKTVAHWQRRGIPEAQSINLHVISGGKLKLPRLAPEAFAEGARLKKKYRRNGKR